MFRESGWLRSFWTKAILSAIIDAHHCGVLTLRAAAGLLRTTEESDEVAPLHVWMARTTSLTSEFYSGQANLAFFYFKLYSKQNEAKIINDFKG